MENILNETFTSMFATEENTELSIIPKLQKSKDKSEIKDIAQKKLFTKHQ